MKKSTTFTKLVQTLLTEEDVKQILQELKYEDTASKFTASQLLLFFMHAALGQWDSYRSGVEKQSPAVLFAFAIPLFLPKQAMCRMSFLSDYFIDFFPNAIVQPSVILAFRRTFCSSIRQPLP
ncbi:hypothetical protein ACFCP7_27650 [Paenibacillus elgii]